MCGQLYAPEISLQGKETLVAIGKETGKTTDRIEM
jgi:hypothetical protein